MLQYKLKHICSRIIASLSAFGLFSITGNVANAAEYEPGQSFTYTYASAKTMTAQYSDLCQYSSGIHIVSAKYENGYCKYTCEEGFQMSGSGSFSVQIPTGTGSGGTEPYTQQTGCEIVTSCATVVNAAAGVLTTSGGTGKCTWTCNNGYSVGGGTSTNTTITEMGSGLITTESTCSARTYTVTFDCGVGGKISGTSNQTMTGKATYGKSFQIPTDAKCEKAGYNFTGWAL